MTTRTLLPTERGFTLIELIITLAIAAIVLAMAVPSFRSIMGDSQIVSTTNDFVSSVHLVRSEAIKRGARAGMCPSTTPLAASAACSAGGSWTSGWIAFIDDNANGVRDGAEEMVVQMEPRGAGFVFTPDAVFSDRVYFAADGSSISSAGIPVSGTVNIKYAAGDQRDVQVSATGRVSTVTP